MIDETRIIAIDFDGTISLADWPDVGPAVPKAIETIKDLQSAGYRLILWTCRTGNHLTKAVSWLESQGVVMDSVNKNLQDVEDAFGPHGSKSTRVPTLTINRFLISMSTKFGTRLENIF